MLKLFRKFIPGSDDPVPAAPDTTVPHHSLVEIFQNRNILKRKLEEAVAEREVLRADVEDLRKRQEESLRQLADLEKMLADPEKGQNAIIYYRLRAIWDTCRNQIRALAEDLTGRQEQVEKAKHAETFEQGRALQLSQLERQRDAVEREKQVMETGIAEHERELTKLRRFWHRSKRHKIQQQIALLREKMVPLESRRNELSMKIDQVGKMPVPAYAGIGIAARRAINLALLSLAQYLYLHFTEHNIAEMARGAGTKPVSDARFGMTNDCLTIGTRLWEVVVKLRNDTSRPEKLRHRTEYLRQKATYTGTGDTIPEEASLDYIPLTAQTAPTLDTVANPLPVNVLRLNYWDIQSLLLKPPEKPEAAPDVKVIAIAD